MTDPVVEEKDKEEIIPEPDGKHPEVVPWNKYVGIKQSLGTKLDRVNTENASLKEQIAKSVKPEEHQKLVNELTTEKQKAAELAKELDTIKATSVAEKRQTLISKGIPKEKADALSGEALNAAVMVLGETKPGKPGADMGSGGGATTLTGNPMELARQAYSRAPSK